MKNKDIALTDAQRSMVALVIIIEVEHMIRVDNMTDQQIVEAYAAYFARKA